jgi:hypothetical protein
MFNTYIRLQKGNWTCYHIWDNRFSTKEYEDMGFTITILKYE